MKHPIPRRLLVALLPADIEHLPQLQGLDSEIRATTAVVIDTLRFTTTACQALHVGARCVQVAPTIERAQQLAAAATPPALLCGERLGHRIDGFDLGNSPVEVTSDRVDGRELVFTTTNGTLAVEAVKHIPTILLAALVNRGASCHYMRETTAGDIVIVCAGTDGQVTWEDVLTAGAILDQLLAQDADFAYGNDSARLAHIAWQATLDKAGRTAPANSTNMQHEARAHPAAPIVACLVQELSRSLGGRNLLESGYEHDLQFAAQLDRLHVVVRNHPEHFDRFIKQ